MPSKFTDRAEPNVVPGGASPASGLPQWIRLPIYLVVSLGLNTTLLTFASQFFGSELRNISETADSFEAAFARLAIRIGILYAGWKLSYDYADISYLNILTNAPFIYLITTYYAVSFQTAALLLGTDVVSTAVPTYCLRRVSDIHNSAAPNPQRYLLNSFQVQSSTRAFAIAAYVIGIWASLKAGQTDLNTYLISQFDISSVELAHAETPLSLTAKLLPVGWAAQAFLLNPSIGAPTSSTSQPKSFDPETASLPDTVRQNLWNWSDRTKVLIKQAAVLLAFTWANTVLRASSLKDTQVGGAIGYAGVWNVINVVITAFFAWIVNT